jgi:hypothetical protein
MADIQFSISVDAPRERVFPPIASGSGLARGRADDVLEDYSPGIVGLAFFNRATVTCLKPVQISYSWKAEWMCQRGAKNEPPRDCRRIEENERRSFISGMPIGELKRITLSRARRLGEADASAQGIAEGEGSGPLFFTHRLES